MSGVSLCLGLRGPLEDATSHVRRERGGLQQQKCTLSQFWRSESKIKCPRGHGPQRALGEGPPSLSQLLVAPGIVWLVKHHPIPCLCLHVAFPVSLFVPSCLWWGCSSGFGLHPNPVWLNLDPYINYICKDPISKEDRNLRFGMDVNWGETLLNPVHLWIPIFKPCGYHSVALCSTCFVFKTKMASYFLLIFQMIEAY